MQGEGKHRAQYDILLCLTGSTLMEVEVLPFVHAGLGDAHSLNHPLVHEPVIGTLLTGTLLIGTVDAG